jgi:histone H3/H4
VIREQDRLMPVANVSRIMRRGLPAHAKISDDAKEVVQDCVSEFISFVTGEANERCHTEHRKTVTAEDLLWALDRLGFDDYVGPLNAFLQRMREIEGGDGGRGPRRGPSLVAPNSAPTTIRPPAVYHQPAYAVGPVPPRPVLASNAAAARFGGRYQMPRGGGQQRSMVPYYYADEASSSNEAPSAPRAAGSRR